MSRRIVFACQSMMMPGPTTSSTAPSVVDEDIGSITMTVTSIVLLEIPTQRGGRKHYFQFETIEPYFTSIIFQSDVIPSPG